MMMSSEVTYIKTEEYNNTVMNHEHYYSCGFGVHHYTCSLNDTSTFSGDYVTELVIFKV